MVIPALQVLVPAILYCKVNEVEHTSDQFKIWLIVNGVPPLPVTVAVPSFPPKQVTFVWVFAVVSSEGSAIKNPRLSEHCCQFWSVTTQ